MHVIPLLAPPTNIFRCEGYGRIALASAAVPQGLPSPATEAQSRNGESPAPEEGT